MRNIFIIWVFVTAICVIGCSGSGSTENPGSSDNNPVVPMVSVNAESTILLSGYTYQLQADVTPSNAEVSWTSSDISIAEVNSSGLVTAKSSGSAVIKAAIVYKDIEYHSECECTVNIPSELTMNDCLRANGSAIDVNGRVQALLPLGMYMQIPLYGAPGVKRRTDGQSWGDYSTAGDMTAYEPLQHWNYSKRTSVPSNISNDDPTDDIFPFTTGAQVEREFSIKFGDLIKTGTSVNEIINSPWILKEITLACWEGYGPYTYNGKAPDGTACKYKNDWYSDYFKIEKFNYGGYSSWYNSPFANYQTPGVSFRPNNDYINGTQNLDYCGSADTGARYHTYETIYRPGSLNAAQGTDTTANSDDVVNGITVYGYTRHGGDNNTGKSADYTNLAIVITHTANRIKLDCATRDEAIRKNLKWMLNQKKFQLIIPIHSFAPLGANLPFIGFMHAGSVETFCFVSINANGLIGLSNAHKISGSSLQTGNCVWGLSGINNNISKIITLTGYDLQHYVCNFSRSGEPDNTLRFMYTSFKDQDYNISMDYSYNTYIEIITFGLPIDLTPILANTINTVSPTPSTVWTCFGTNSFFPADRKEKIEQLLPLTDLENSSGRIIDSVYVRSVIE